MCDIKREVYYEKRRVIAKDTMCIGVRERSGVRGREREDFLTELATKTRCLPPVSTPLSPSPRCCSHPPQACVSSKAYLTLCSHSERLPWYCQGTLSSLLPVMSTDRGEHATGDMTEDGSLL